MFAGHPIQDSKPQFKKIGRKPEIRREEPLRPLYVIKVPPPNGEETECQLLGR